MNIAIKTLEGRDHWVCPTVMITVGIHAGSHGPIFYPAEELQATAALWNSRPVVVYHPQMYGNGYVGNPEIFNRQKVGVLFNSQFDGSRLLAEAWIDAARVGQVDHRVERTIRAGRVMEVSTGMGMDAVSQPGVWNGAGFEYRAHRIMPDHLAILPDQRGACSIADGAGLCRNRHAAASATRAATGYSYAAGQAAATALAVANEANDESPLVMPSLWE